MKFISEIFHPNGNEKTFSFTINEFISLSIVYPDGRVCISILHAPGDDPMVRFFPFEKYSLINLRHI